MYELNGDLVKEQFSESQNLMKKLLKKERKYFGFSFLNIWAKHVKE